MSSNRENMVNPLNTSTKNVIGRENDIYGSCKSVSNYEKIERIGEGTYGDVYCAVNKATKSVVALKRIILHNEKQDGFPLTSLREISALRRSSHPNIVSLLDVVVGGRRDGVFLVFEYCEHDLSSLMRNIKKPFMESEVKRLTMQLLSAVGYLHDHWIIHRDIKLSNLLYNNYGMLKLADFGLCRTFSNPPVAMTHKVVTLWYRAPELLLGAEDYTTAIDTWSIGCVMGELLLGQPLLPGDEERSQIKLIIDLLGCPNDKIWPGVAELPLIANGSINLAQELARSPYNSLNVVFPKLGHHGINLLNLLLAYDSKKRICPNRALRHEYFFSSPYPKEAEFMPTYPSHHGDAVAAAAEGGRDLPAHHAPTVSATVSAATSSSHYKQNEERRIDRDNVYDIKRGYIRARSRTRSRSKSRSRSRNRVRSRSRTSRSRSRSR